MSTWVRMALGAAIIVAFSAHAQQLKDRQIHVAASKAEALQQLQNRFQQAADGDEIEVQAYLSQNPGVERSFVKNNAQHYLIRLDTAGRPVYIATEGNVTAKNVASGQLIKANSLYLGGSIGVNITGTGMLAAIWDGGQVRETHELLQGHVTNQAAQAATQSDHMTHVSGTLVGKQIANAPTARGVAFNGSTRNYWFNNDKPGMVAFAAEGYLISNHSYGYVTDNTLDLWKFGAYNFDSNAWDVITKNAPYYQPFTSAGNGQSSNGNMTKAGYDVFTGPKVSKNVIAVGALGTALDPKAMSDYSNWGPTDDGRVKPNLVAKGSGINSAQATSDTAYSGNDVNTSSGTSYASPAAAASGLLLQQYYKTLNPTYMLASTLKALMQGTTEDLGRPGPDHQFGWGLLNVENAALTIKRRTPSPSPGAVAYTYPAALTRGSVIEEITVNPVNNSTDEIQRVVTAKGGVPLVVNLGWTDDEGTEQLETDGVDPAISRLVYEFDLMVSDNAAVPVTTRSWKIPGMANRTDVAAPGTVWFDGNGDNFKQVLVANPAAGAVYTIVIRKKAGSPATARTLSLVVTGLVEGCGGYAPITACNLDADGDGYFDARDGQLILRRLLGLRDAALIDGLPAVRACALRKTGIDVAGFVDFQSTLSAAPKPLDIDGDGQVLASTDGLMLLRVALGITGDAVVANATAAGAPRRTWALVQPYLVQQCGLNVGL